MRSEALRTKHIHRLNKIIAEKEASGVENANDYRDQRNLLMDQLAGYTYYTYNEDVDGKVQIYINNAPLVIALWSNSLNL